MYVNNFLNLVFEVTRNNLLPISMACSTEFDMDNENFDPVHFILNNPFSSLTFEQKVKLKSKITRPSLNLSQKDGKVTRKFQNTWYSKYRWLCGSSVKETLHCYYCLLFGGEEPWSHSGIITIKNFEAKAVKHAGTKTHIKNAEMFHMLGRSRIDHCLSEATRLQDLKHNENVTQNRRIVGRLIDVVCHLGRQELAFRGHREDEESLNKGNYLEILNLLAMEELFMRDHLDTNSVFKGISPDIQNDLIKAVAIVIRENIVRELSEAEFVSIQADETTDVSIKAQLSLIVRYVHGVLVQERFLGFYDVSADKSAQGLATKIIDVLKECNISNKVICQTYDGASVMAGRHRGVQTLVREYCPQALFVHCYAHQLNLVLLHGAKNIKEVKLFICNITCFHTFFSRSSTRSEVLRQMGFKLPHPAATRWNYNSRAVATIKEHYQELMRATSHIVNSDEFDPESISGAIGLQNILNSSSFLFLLCVYHHIFVFTEHLFNVLQAKSTSNVNLCINEIRTTMKNVTSLRSEEVLKKCLDECRLIHPECQIPDTFSSAQKRVAFEIIDTIIVQLDIRFGQFENISFVELLNELQYTAYRTQFPQAQLEKLNTMFPNVFNCVTLRSELINIYNSDDKILSAPKLLAYILDNQLECVYEQTLKLLKLVLSIPVTSASSERSMSALKRIKTYLRNSMGNNRLSHLAALSIEKELCHRCSREPSFKERVIDVFAEMKTRRTELIYKKIN